MTNYDVSDPDFSTAIEQLTTQSPGHANTFNPLFLRAYKNEAYLKKIQDDNIEKLENLNVRINNLEGLIVPKLSNKDAKGNYITVTFINSLTNKELLQSVASNYNSSKGQYETYTLTFYKEDGSTVDSVYVVTPTYDGSIITDMGVIKQ